MDIIAILTPSIHKTYTENKRNVTIVSRARVGMIRNHPQLSVFHFLSLTPSSIQYITFVRK